MTHRIVLAASLLISGAFAAAAEPDETLLRKLNASVTNADAALKADPNDLAALQDRGDALFFLGRFDEAVRDYDRMILLRPQLGPRHWQRGLALYFAGRYDDSARQFERYFEGDKSDRENGIWRYYAHVKKNGVDAARKSLLVYENPDRAPLPIIYRMCEGEATPQDVLDTVAAADLTAAERRKQQFYADLYVGLDAAIVRNDTSAARKRLERALENPWPRESSYGPQFMWHIARLSLAQLDAPPR